jgi:hypothetical protein
MTVTLALNLKGLIMAKPIDPLKFIDSLDLNNSKHIVLFYEEVEDAKRIQYQFLRNSLSHGTNTVYAIAGDDAKVIENELASFGIDVEAYNKKNLLHVISFPSLTDYECQKPEEIIQNFLDKNLSHLKPPFNMVSRLFQEIKTKEEVKCVMELEKAYQRHFRNFNSNVICSYPVKEIDKEMYGEWVYVLLQNHNASIILSDSTNKGLAIDMR